MKRKHHRNPQQSAQAAVEFMAAIGIFMALTFVIVYTLQEQILKIIL